MHILQVSTYDSAGGAEQIAWNLFRAYRERGLTSQLAVGWRRGATDPDVHELSAIDLARQGWSGRLARRIRRKLGHDEFAFPSTAELPGLGDGVPDLLHCHNLHGEYFDLRALPALCRQLPVILTMHDAWLLSGHCAHSLGCERWKHGCGRCPDLSIYFPLKRDGTAHNWTQKKRIFADCRLFVSAPSAWMLSQLEDSILAPAVIESRVIPNGIEQDIFRPGDMLAARRELGLPADARVLLFAANGPRQNHFKDFHTVYRAVEQIKWQTGDPELVLIALGEAGQDEQAGHARVSYVGRLEARSAVATYFRAADLYLHAARAESFGMVVAEALSVGTPVVATAVGGVAEQLRSLAHDWPHGRGVAGQPVYRADAATGVLVDVGDADSMAAACQYLLGQPALRAKLGANAAADAAARFSLTRQVDAYLDWYRDILART